MSRKILVGLLLVMFFAGCAKRIVVSYDQVEKDTFVKIKTHTNKCYHGIVKAKQPSFLVLQANRNSASLSKIERNNIYNIQTNLPVYDYQNKVISEWEIQDNQGTKNTLLYAVGGVGLSFGTSFFIGSLIHRSLSDSEYRNTALWSTTGIGTAIGTYFFIRTGRKKDREASILSIRESRYLVAKKEVDLQKQKRQEINKELEKMKTDRQKQDAEMKRLMKRIKDREKGGDEK